MNHIALGDKGEQIAASYLRRKRYRLLAQKYRSSFGEIDIVAAERDALVFVEVKTRRSAVCGRPAEAVDQRKKRRLIAGARSYLQQARAEDVPCRFDVIEVYYADERSVSIRHIINAFSL